MFRAGNKTADRIYRNEGESLLEFVARAINEGFNASQDSVIVMGPDKTKSFLVMPETADKEGLTGTTVKDALHIKMRLSKPSELLDVIRMQSEQQKGKGQQSLEFKPYEVKRSLKDADSVEKEFGNSEEADKIKAEAKVQAKQAALIRPELEMKDDYTSDQELNDEKVGLGYQPNRDEKFANKSEKQKQIEARVSNFESEQEKSDQPQNREQGKNDEQDKPERRSWYRGGNDRKGNYNQGNRR